MFEPYTRDLRSLRRELKAFGALLQAERPLSEMRDVLPFVRRSRHLAAAFGFANRALVAPNLLAVERPVLGSFRCDIAIGNATAQQFTLVELEDARESSVFEPVTGRDYPRWSGRFERGFSQLVDWAWRIDHERQPSVTLEAAFGTGDPQIHYLLVHLAENGDSVARRGESEMQHVAEIGSLRAAAGESGVDSLCESPSRLEGEGDPCRPPRHHRSSSRLIMNAN